MKPPFAVRKQKKADPNEIDTVVCDADGKFVAAIEVSAPGLVFAAALDLAFAVASSEGHADELATFRTIVTETARA